MMKKYFPNKAAPIMGRIKRYMRKQKVTQAEMAKNLFDGKHTQISDRIVGNTEMSLSEYMAICEYLDVPYDFFMKREDGF